MSKIKVAMLPLDIRQADPQHNIDAVRQFAGTIDHDTDILALPELFSTGFINDKSEATTLAESIDGPAISALRDIATDRNIAVTGSFLCIADDGTLRNRAFFINPDIIGAPATFYDKRHLFVLSHEKDVFASGCELPPVTLFRGWRIAITVCYDLRFPVWMRNVGPRYDMMIVPANWPDSRAYAWNHLLIARAIENQAVYIGVNRSGEDDFGTYSPDLTSGYNELGTPINQHTGSLMQYATFGLDEINTLRHRFPVHLNADDFILR